MARIAIDWDWMAEAAGYPSERDMWDDLYVKRGWGGRRIEAYLGPSHSTIRKRVRALNYKVHPPGGKWNTRERREMRDA